MHKEHVNRNEFLKFSSIVIAGSLLAACASQAPETPVEPAQETVTEKPKPTPPSPTRQVPLPDTTTVEVLAEGLDFPEGPAFDPEGNLWCTELIGGNLVRWSGGQIQRYPTGGRPNGLAFDQQGRAWVCDSGQNAIRRFDPGSETWETLADSLDGVPLQSPNDLCFDASGNLIFTCPNFASKDPLGYVCCLTPEGRLVKIAENWYRPNGLDIVDSGKALVVADTYRKSLYKGGWDAETHSWVNPILWAQVGGAEGPDGMAPDKDGFLYQAIYGDGVILVLDSRGEIVRSYTLPGKNPTNVAIDPSRRLGLVVTEAEKGQLLSLPDVRVGEGIFR